MTNSNTPSIDMADEIASMLYNRCSCTEMDSGGDCDWCMCYYGRDYPTEIEKLARLTAFEISAKCHGPSLGGEWFDRVKGYEVIVQAIREAKIEALREAAKTICVLCDGAHSPKYDATATKRNGWLHRSEFSDNPCYAHSIHELIDELEQETP